jgi:CxxC-x17-CxxC domain-containing protein
MTFTDKPLRCADCGQEFVWTAGEQEFFAGKNLQNEPRRCKTCKSRRASSRPPARAHTPREDTVATCSSCGKETTVPFRPSPGRPVFCRDCFHARRR